MPSTTRSHTGSKRRKLLSDCEHSHRPNPAPSNIPILRSMPPLSNRIDGGSDERACTGSVRKCIRKNEASIGPISTGLIFKTRHAISASLEFQFHLVHGPLADSTSIIAMSVKPSFPHNEDRIWLTGFEPFGSHAENPSQALVEQLLETNHVQELVTTPPYHLESDQVEVQFNGQILSVDEEGVAAVFRKLEISMRSFT